MSDLIFKADEVRRIVEHSLAAPKQRLNWGRKTAPREPSIILVHDHGVYLMSNGEPPDRIIKKGKEWNYVCYARGCDPDKQTFDEWWETSRDLVGGSDFADTLPWAKEIKSALDGDPKLTEVIVRFSEKSLGLDVR